MPIIGAHVSTNGGLSKCFENAAAMGAKAIQIFGSSPQQWFTKMPTAEAIQDFTSKKTNAGSPPVYLHAGYLVNLTSPNPINREKSIKSLAEHYQIAQSLNAEGLIFHLGSFGEEGHEKGLKNLISGIREVLKKVPGNARLILENSAGGGNKLGKTLEELAEIFEGVNSPRAKFCFDTAHAFEAGMIGYESAKKVEEFFNLWDKKIGIGNIEVLHSNDSKTIFESHNDRHENIGQGEIGKKGFTNLAKEKRLHGKVWLLEVPGEDDRGPDKENIEKLKALF
ncbi:MAG: deoxyribonuclease IV [bacterium]|nr:deoxyribonuclease IV [bacterium]